VIALKCTTCGTICVSAVLAISSMCYGDHPWLVLNGRTHTAGISGML